MTVEEYRDILSEFLRQLTASAPPYSEVMFVLKTLLFIFSRKEIPHEQRSEPADAVFSGS